MVPLPLARGDFFALSCCCTAGAQVMLLLALAVALVSWPLAWMLQLEVPPGRRWLVSWPLLARFVPRAVPGLGRGQQRPGWSQARRRARPQVPAVAACAVLTLQQQQRPTPSIPQPCRRLPGHVRGLAGEHLARHTMAGSCAQSGCAIQPLACIWPAFRRATGGLRGRVYVLDTQSRRSWKGGVARRGPGGALQTKTKTAAAICLPARLSLRLPVEECPPRR